MNREASLRDRIFKFIHMNDVDEKLFLNHLVNINIPVLVGAIEDTVSDMKSLIYHCTKKSRREQLSRDVNDALGRWERL